MTFSVRQALIDSGHFTEAPNRILVHEQAVDHVGIVGNFIVRSVLRFDMFGDLVGVESYVVDVNLRNVVAQNRQALGLPPPEDK